MQSPCVTLHCHLWPVRHVEASWNVMAHAQKPDFVFRRNWRVHLNRSWGRQFSRLLAAEVCDISGSNAGYTMFQGIVKGTGYPLNSPVSPSLQLPFITVYHHSWTGVYHISPQYLVKNTMFWRRNLFNAKCVLISYTAFVSIRRRISQDVTMNVQRSPCTVPGVLVNRKRNMNFSRHNFEKSTNTKFHENPSVGSELFHAYGRTATRADMTKLIQLCLG